MTEKTRGAARRRPTIGANPLDVLISETPPVEQPDTSPSSPASGTSGRPVPGGLTKVRATFHLPAELLDEARDVVVALSGPPARLTLAELAETALRREIARLKATYNGGTDFPPRDADLRGGRPIRS